MPVSLALGVGNNDAAALGRVMSPLPCRWFGEPLIPSDAFGVGSSSHSTSSARFGPWPPLFRFDGCWLPPFFPMLLVGIFSRVPGGPCDEVIWTIRLIQRLCTLCGVRRVPTVRVVKVPDAVAGQPQVRLVDAAGEPVAEVGEFLRLLTVRAHSTNTVRAYAYDLLKLYLFCEEHGITAGEFTPARAVEFLEWLRLVSSSRRARRLELGVATGEGRLLSPKTCNRVLAAVSSFYEFLIVSEQYAGRDNPIVKNVDQAAARVPDRYRPPLMNARRQQPVRRVLRVKTVEPVPRPMPDDVYRALLDELRTRRDLALLEVMWEGGLRPGEVLGLQLEDISYGQRRVTVRKRDDHPRGVRQKSRRDRVVDLWEGRALAALNAYVMRERPADVDTPWVFLVGGRGKRRGEPLGYDALVRMFARAAQRAGVRDAWLTPHSLRHTHATRMFEGGMRELTLMTRLGHATPDSMKVYTRVSDPEVVKDYRRAIGERDT
ncbi:tyrosine-type recombinase/integrase [Streptomyces sp. NPDC059166]|uniref:tyrosine-type recombinase/integrase n=2 Tax=Streptomyces TaxID=1883 RepID=UPI0036D0A496